MTGLVTGYDREYSYGSYLKYYMDVENPIAIITTNAILKLGVGIDNLYGVPTWTNEGSIIEVNNFIVVKLAETY